MYYVKLVFIVVAINLVIILYLNHLQIFHKFDFFSRQHTNSSSSRTLISKSNCFNNFINQNKYINNYKGTIEQMEDGDYLYINYDNSEKGTGASIKRRLHGVVHEELASLNSSGGVMNLQQQFPFCSEFVFKKDQDNLTIKQHEASCFYPVEMLKQYKQLFITNLQIIRDEFERRNLLLMLFYGSYIGSMRFQSTIPYDDDIDFIFLDKDREKVRKLFQDLVKNKTNKFVFNDKIREHWKLGFLCTSKAIGSCKMEIDFFRTLETKKSHEYYTTWTWGGRKFDYYLLYPNLWRPYHGIMFRSPRNLTTYMRQTYSDSDQTCHFVKPHKFYRSAECKHSKINCRLLRYKYPYTLSDDQVFVSSINRAQFKITVELLIHHDKVLSIFIYATNKIYHQKYVQNQLRKLTTTTTKLPLPIKSKKTRPSTSKKMAKINLTTKVKLTTQTTPELLKTTNMTLNIS